ncbi:DUF5677 domain-containing protein [Ottowia oryzae]|uniref:DUF5677 domain-containing protein n=1 Tax=Ottowia oryzae TaxID=2109914 RepID=UPI000F5121EA|nr:DUF5677 domain-containing protein [Ottowia oryzae]
MRPIKSAVQNAARELPAVFLRKLLLRKAKEAEIPTPKKFSEALAAHLLAGGAGEFVWTSPRGKGEKSFNLTLTDEDIGELEANIENAIEKFPIAITKASDRVSRLSFDNLCQKWIDEYKLQSEDFDSFRNRLNERWGVGLDHLRMLLTCCRELGYESFKRHKRSRSFRHHYRRWVLLRLHVRSCQVADEVICLMENGFADGALARWRTLHEIAVVATLIAEGDEALAERYILHDDVELKRQADDHDATQVPMGFSPIGKRQRSAIELRYKAAIDRFGKAFASPYGWAADALELKKPTFKDLQEKAGHQAMNSYYKLASFNVHAGARSLFFNLSSIGTQEILLAGRSNAGLFEPGVRTAQTLALITSLYVEPGSDMDRLTELKTILRIRDAVMPALKAADELLHRDEMSRLSRLASRRARSKRIDQRSP